MSEHEVMQFSMNFFFEIPFYLQSVPVHSANCVKDVFHEWIHKKANLCNRRVQLWDLSFIVRSDTV
jgi:hypothetical protein